MIEEWRKIVGYEGLYEVSSFGRVRSLDRFYYRLHKGKFLSPTKDRYGYLTVTLNCNGKSKTIKIHRLVAQAFLPNPDNLPQVNHKDEVKSNNCVENLEWCDGKYNVNYGTRQERYRNTMLEKGHWSGLSREEYEKKRYQENKDKRKDSQRKYYQKNKDRICERQKEYSQKNKEKIREYHHQYYLKKKEENIQNNVKSLNDKV